MLEIVLLDGSTKTVDLAEFVALSDAHKISRVITKKGYQTTFNGDPLHVVGDIGFHHDLKAFDLILVDDLSPLYAYYYYGSLDDNGQWLVECNYPVVTAQLPEPIFYISSFMVESRRPLSDDELQGYKAVIESKQSQRLMAFVTSLEYSQVEQLLDYIENPEFPKVLRQYKDEYY